MSFSLRVCLDGTFGGIDKELLVAAMQTTVLATLCYGSVRGVIAWAHN